MRESASTDLREPQGSNPLGPPGPKPRKGFRCFIAPSPRWEPTMFPWIDPATYQPEKSLGGRVYNGEGSLVYPARAAGYEGIVPSLRLKALRDSIEDYEYLAIMERLGLADGAMNEVVPRAGSWTHWATDPAAFEKARTRLAEAIVNVRKAK
jgi:Domain of unknown function (DUF4091)